MYLSPKQFALLSLKAEEWSVSVRLKKNETKVLRLSTVSIDIEY